MSWLYSRALGEAFLRAGCSDGARSALSSTNPTPRAFLPPDRTTAFSRLSRFGMTYGHLTDDLGAELLMWFLAASRARTSVWPEKAQASTENAPGSGATWRGSLAKFDPGSSTWRTAQPSLLGDSDECSVTWPRSGMTAGGLCWELPMSVLRTSGTGSGSWLYPTPTCNPEAPNHGSNSNGPHNLKEVALTRWKPGQMWPTPISQDAKHSGYAKSGPGMADKLSYAVVRWPTPVARMWKDGGHPAEFNRNEIPLAARVGGSLNPMWVEWLMGWPLGWTDLKPLETARFHSAPQPHGESLQAEAA